MEKVCKKHGLTDHTETKKKRCRKCLVEAVTRWRRNLKKKAVDYKGGSCKYCGYNKHLGALEFHHPDPTQKDFALGHEGVCRSWAKVKEEIDKCELVCKNCHVEIHYGLVAEMD